MKALLYLLIGFMAGGFTGIGLMCLMTINKEETRDKTTAQYAVDDGCRADAGGGRVGDAPGR